MLAGKYRVGRVLGAGAMGVVVAAHHMQLDTPVAIKLLWPSIACDREALRRFAWEARAMAKIPGEHVARVLDLGSLENEAPFMVMEFLDGVDLARWMDTQGALPAEQAVDFLLQTCIAVADAHRLGIVHRDLKPSNLFCIRRANGRHLVKVLDFGISKLTGASASRSDNLRTTASDAAGSPLYMSPEQAKSSRDVDQRTDIWALGAILFELLTLKKPFQGQTLHAVCTQIAHEEPASVRSFRPDVPAGLEAVIRKCLEKSPEKRFQSVAELAQALLEFGPENAKALVAHISGKGRHWRSRAASHLGGSSAAARPWSSLSRVLMPPFTFVVVLLLVWNGTYLYRSKLAVTASRQNSALSDSRPAAIGLAPDTSTARASPPILSSAPHAMAPSFALAKETPPGPLRSARPLGPRAKLANDGVRLDDAGGNFGASSCEPPYYFDANGNRVFKINCL